MEEPLKILLETGRLRLRRLIAADLENLFDLDIDPEVMRFINGGAPTPRAVIRDEILPGFLRYDDHRPGFGVWAAEERASGDFLGWFSFRPSGETTGEVVLGYRLRRAAWGRGYATEGARALLHRGFTTWGVRRVIATTYEENLASRRVMEKLGMSFVRAFRLTPEEIVQADTFHSGDGNIEIWDGDDVEYALDRDDWVRRETASP